MNKYSLNDVCFFDCETTGLPAKGAKWDVDFNEFPHIVQLAWSFRDKERNCIIKPNGWTIPSEVVEIHGITTELAIEKGVSLFEVVNEFISDALSAPLVCAHNIYFDISIIKAEILRGLGREYYDSKVEYALHKAKRIDTMMKTIRFVDATYPDGRRGKFPRLEELFAKLFNGETFSAHDALEDVRALKRCLSELVNLDIIKLEKKEY